MDENHSKAMEKMCQIEKALGPLLKRLRRSFHDFMARANENRLRRIAKISGLPIDMLRACKNWTINMRKLASLEPHLWEAQRKKRPALLEFVELCASEAQESMRSAEAILAAA